MGGTINFNQNFGYRLSDLNHPSQALLLIELRLGIPGFTTNSAVNSIVLREPILSILMPFASAVCVRIQTDQQTVILQRPPSTFQPELSIANFDDGTVLHSRLSNYTLCCVH